MPTPVLHSADFNEGYRITSTGDSLLVEATDHHAMPLRLSREQLVRFALRLEHDHYIPLNKPGNEAEEKSVSVVDQIFASLQNVVGLVERQRAKKKWKWDLANLRRTQIILGGLDEEVVQRILSEEKF